MRAYARRVPRPLRDQSAGIRHVTCRGNRREAIFGDDDDREVFLRLLDRVRRACAWRVYAWCLMTNHVHLVLAVPAETVSRGMQSLCGDYGQTFNWRHGFTGHLFQGRFGAEVIRAEKHLFEAVRYVDRNPERAGLEPWRWSSYWAHVGYEQPRTFHDTSVVRSFGASRRSAAVAYERFVDEARRTDAREGHVHVQTRHVRGLTPDMAVMDMAEKVGQPKP